MDAGLMKKYCWNRSGIDEENLAEIEAGLIIRILLNESGIFYKINIIFCAELSETNCRAELSTPNCPTPIRPRRIVRAELSCAELSGNRYVEPATCYVAPAACYVVSAACYVVPAACYVQPVM